MNRGDILEINFLNWLDVGNMELESLFIYIQVTFRNCWIFWYRFMCIIRSHIFESNGIDCTLSKSHNFYNINFLNLTPNSKQHNSLIYTICIWRVVTTNWKLFQLIYIHNYPLNSKSITKGIILLSKKSETKV